MSMFLGGRWLTGKLYARVEHQSCAHGQGFGCSASGMAAKLYIAEIAPPRSRGAWMGVLNSFYYVGQILASGVAVSDFAYHSDYPPDQ
jgi:MFS family permease